jgi:PAS domain S-box-containing protein
MVLMAVMFRTGRRGNLNREKGWSFILVGLCLVLFGSVIDVVFHFPFFSDIPALKSSQVFLEDIVGYLLGVLLMASGFIMWIPALIARREADEEILERDRRFKATFIMNPDVMVVSRVPDGLIIDVNKSFCKFFGYTREEAIGRTSLELEIWADAQDQSIMMHLVRENGFIDNKEIQLRTKDGEIRTTIFTATVLPWKDEHHLLTIVKDITERKHNEILLQKSLREKETLVKEVHHRVKSNLQSISGLLELQSVYLKDKQAAKAFRDSQDRIRTMSSIHEELYQTEDLASINFAAFIKRLVNNLSISHGIDLDVISLNVDADEMNLIMDTAIPCGLIINELVSNSFRHAFPDKRKGRISIIFRSMGEGEYSLVVSDNGIGLPVEVQFSNPSTLGMQLIHTISTQLGATVDLKSEGGTTFSMIFMEYSEAGSVLY